MSKVSRAPRAAASAPQAGCPEDQKTPERARASTPSHWAAAALLVVFPEARLFPIPLGDTLVGRAKTCDIQLEGRDVSRTHARLVRDETHVFVEDLGSTNGVHVNTEPCTRGELQHGDVVRFGDQVAILLGNEATQQQPFAATPPGVWGSGAVHQVFERVERIAPSDLCVLIQGESGTGKEAVAQRVHARSGRRGQFVAVNCGALSDSLLEAELFGHDKGAFTHGVKSRAGYVHEAHGGTLFLDEVGELSLKAQASLLRVIQTGQVTRLGERQPVTVDVRWVAATHRDLQKRIRAKKFRFDLYQRLAGVTLTVPALRERREDILPLFKHFVSRQEQPEPELSDTLVEALCCYAWPGNLRELELTAKAMRLLIEPGLRWEREHLPSALLAALKPAAEVKDRKQRSAALQDHKPAHTPVATVRRKRSRSLAPSPAQAEPGVNPRRALDAKTLLAALKAEAGNLSAAARALGKTRQAIYLAVKRCGLEPELDAIRRASS